MRLDDPGRHPGAAGGSKRPHGPWHQPVVWLSVTLFSASLAGCVLMIVLAMRHPDATPATGRDVILKMPVKRTTADSLR